MQTERSTLIGLFLVMMYYLCTCVRVSVCGVDERG